MLSTPRHRGTSNAKILLSVDEIKELLITKSRGGRTRIVGADMRFCRSGFINTTEGAVLTSEVELRRARENKSRKTPASIKKELAVERRALRPEQKKAQKLIKTSGRRCINKIRRM